MNVGFVIILLIIVLLCVRYFIMNSKKKLFLSGRAVKYILVAYLTALVLSAAALYALPEDGLVERVRNYENPIQAEHSQIYDYSRSGNLEKLKGLCETKSYKFKYAGNILTLEKLGDADSINNIQIWIERKNVDDQKIEAFSMKNKTIIYGLDVTKKIPHADIELRDDTLVITQMKSRRFDCVAFKNDITASQFLPKSNDEGRVLMAWFDIHYIYLKVPKNLRINDDTLNVNYVNPDLQAK